MTKPALTGKLLRMYDTVDGASVIVVVAAVVVVEEYGIDLRHDDDDVDRVAVDDNIVALPLSLPELGNVVDAIVAAAAAADFDLLKVCWLVIVVVVTVAAAAADTVVLVGVV